MSSLKVHKNTNAYYFILELIMWPSSFKTCHLTVKSHRAHFAMRRRQNISDSQAQECEGHMISFKNTQITRYKGITWFNALGQCQ